MNLAGFTLDRITPEISLPPFCCKDDDLNDFYWNDAVPNLMSLNSVTYLLRNKDFTLAFYSVLNDKISYQDVQSNRWYQKHIRDINPKGKRFSAYPAVKIGRLGVHRDYQSSGIGTKVIDFIKKSFITNNKTGCKFITVDAYNNERTLNFYSRNGFKFLPVNEKSANPKTKLMYFDLSSLKGNENK